MAAKEMKSLRKWNCVSQNRTLVFVVLMVFGQINYSVIGTCKVDVNGMSIILARRDEMSHGVAEFYVFNRGALCLHTRHLSVQNILFCYLRQRKLGLCFMRRFSKHNISYISKYIKMSL